MICYRDKTFCKYRDCGKFGSCDRALTEFVKDSAEKWWGNKDAPIAVFIDKPECYEEKK